MTFRNSFKRELHSHKGDYGHALIIAGSAGMAGAALLACKAALRSGVGKVTLATTAEVYAVIGKNIPEALTLMLPIAQKKGLPSAGIDLIRNRVNEFDAIAIGPGLGVSSQSHQIVLKILAGYQKRIVLDADALNVLGSDLSNVLASKAEVILTPHEGEFARLFPNAPKPTQANRKWVAKQMANQYDCTLVRKGSCTIIASPDGSVFSNRTGNPGMASGGMGDVLTGLMSGLVAQDWETLDAVRLAVHIHGKAGDLAKAEVGESALIASDVLDFLPRALIEFENKHNALKDL